MPCRNWRGEEQLWVAFLPSFFHSPLVSLHKGALQIWHPSGFYPIYKSRARLVQLSTGETCCVVVFIVNNFRGILAVCLRLVCDAPHQKNAGNRCLTKAKHLWPPTTPPDGGSFYGEQREWRAEKMCNRHFFKSNSEPWNTTIIKRCTVKTTPPSTPKNIHEVNKT